MQRSPYGVIQRLWHVRLH